MKQNYYFIGIGGIGMSALARYFNLLGAKVYGYDRTPSELTHALESEGMAVHYTDSVDEIPQSVQADNTIVVITPAIPKDNKEYLFFKENSFTILKRAQVLGLICKEKNTVAIAGTHGKTSTTTFTTFLLKNSTKGCSAFLGGISKNFQSNFVFDAKSPFVVVEADEFDRSFHHLLPYMAVITAADADHLDIYGTHEAYLESFAHFTSLIQEGGCLVMKKGIKLQPRLKQGVELYTYSATEKADFYAENIRVGNGELVFDFVTPNEKICNINLGVPVLVNVENGVATLTATGNTYISSLSISFIIPFFINVLIKKVF